MDLVGLDPESLLQMERGNCHASRPHETFVDAEEKRAGALHAARQHTFVIIAGTRHLLLDIGDNDATHKL